MSTEQLATDYDLLCKKYSKLMQFVLVESPCTCENPEPHDWPHDPENRLCHLNVTHKFLAELKDVK